MQKVFLNKAYRYSTNGYQVKTVVGDCELPDKFANDARHRGFCETPDTPKSGSETSKSSKKDKKG